MFESKFLGLEAIVCRGRRYKSYSTKKRTEAKIERGCSRWRNGGRRSSFSSFSGKHFALSSFQYWGALHRSANSKSNGLYRQSSCFPKKFQRAFVEKQGVLHREVYDYEKCPDDLMDALSFESYLTRILKPFSNPDGFMLYGKLGVEFISTSELLYPKMKVRLRIIRASPNFNINGDNGNITVALRIVDFLFSTRRDVLKDDYHKKMEKLVYTPVYFNHQETLTKTFTIPASQKQFNQKKTFFTNSSSPLC